MNEFKVKPIYMDHSVTAPVSPQVFNELKPYFTDSYNNVSSIRISSTGCI